MPINIRFDLRGNSIKDINNNADVDLLKTLLSVDHVIIDHTTYKIINKTYDDDLNMLKLFLSNFQG